MLRVEEVMTAVHVRLSRTLKDGRKSLRWTMGPAKAAGACTRRMMTASGYAALTCTGGNAIVMFAQCPGAQPPYDVPDGCRIEPAAAVEISFSSLYCQKTVVDVSCTWRTIEGSPKLQVASASRLSCCRHSPRRCAAHLECYSQARSCRRAVADGILQGHHAAPRQRNCRRAHDTWTVPD